MKNKKKIQDALALGITLALLGGESCLAAPDVVTSTGVSTSQEDNSITSSGRSSASPMSIYGAYKPAATPVDITLSGDKKITVTALGRNDYGQTNRNAFAYGTYNLDSLKVASGDSGDITIKVTAIGEDDSAYYGTNNRNANGYAHGIAYNGVTGSTASFKADNFNITTEAVGANITYTMPTNTRSSAAVALTNGLNVSNVSNFTMDVDGNVNINATARAQNVWCDGRYYNLSATASTNGVLFSPTANSTLKISKDLNIVATGRGGTVTNASTDMASATNTANADATGNGLYVLGTGGQVNVLGDVNIELDLLGGTATSSRPQSTGSPYSTVATSNAIGNGVYQYNTTNSIITIEGNLTVKNTVKAGSVGATDNDALTSIQTRNYGVYSGSTNSEIIIKGDTDIDLKNIGGTFTSGNIEHATGDATTAALAAFTTGRITPLGNVKIKVDSVQNYEKTGFEYRSFATQAGGSGGVVDLSSTGTIKEIEGDVYASAAGKNILNLDTNNSYLRGNIINYNQTPGYEGINDVTVTNGAKWQPIYDNRFGAYIVPGDVSTYGKTFTVDTVTTTKGSKLTLKDGGTVDLLWDGARNTYRNIDIYSLAGTDGVFNLATDLDSQVNGDKIHVTNADPNTKEYITVEDVSSTNGNMVKGYKKLLVATDDSGNAVFLGKSLDLGGLWETVPTITNEGNNWYLTMLRFVPNLKTETLIGGIEGNYAFWRSGLTNDTLRQRLGDLRENTEEEGVWARVKAGKLAGASFDQSYQMYQVGIDKKQDNTYYGIAIDHGKGSSEFSVGHGDNSMTDLTLYATTYHEKGHYSDFVLKAGKISNDLYVNGALSDSMDYSDWAYSISYELGKKINYDKGWFVEPEAQLVYGHMGGDTCESRQGTLVNIDGISSLLGRVGVVAGRKVNKDSDYYFKANVWREFKGDGDADFTALNNKGQKETMLYSTDHKDTWFELGLGGNVKIAKKTHLYGDIEKSFGANIQKKWQINAGVRWEF